MKEVPVGHRVLTTRPTLLGSGNPDALQNVNPTPLPDNVVCFVASEGAFFRLDKFSSEAINEPRVIATILGPSARGRWVRVSEIVPSTGLSGSLVIVNAAGTAVGHIPAGPFGATLESDGQNWSYIESPIELWSMDSSPFLTGGALFNVVELWGYSRAQLNSADHYTGAPAKVIRLWPLHAGRGHGFAVLRSGHFLISTSEQFIDGNNGGESWLLIDPDANGDLTAEQTRRFRCDRLFFGTPNQTTGARDVAQFSDGTILVGSKRRWLKVTLEQLLADEVDGLPTWFINAPNGEGPNGQMTTYDLAVIPGTHTAVINADNRFLVLDFDVAPGLIADGDRKIAHGTNIGVWGAYGPLAVTAEGVWKSRPRTPDFVLWDWDTVNALPSEINLPGGNPLPTRIVTSPTINAMNLAQESMYAGFDFDDQHRMWVQSRHDPSLDGAPTYTTPARAMRFPTEATLFGGSHEPDKVVSLPISSQPFSLRCARDKRYATR
jgi:hypothetical protein